MVDAKLVAWGFIVLLFVLSFTQTALSEEGIHTDNIVIILDASGSMKEKFSHDPTKTKMEAAKEALREVLAKIPAGTNIGLLVFSGANVQNEWVYPLGPKNDAELITAINLPFPSGGTPLGQYIKIGTDRLLEQREKQYNYGSYRLLIVTDGEADDPNKVAAYTPEVIERQIRVDVIGVDMKQDHMLATVVDSYRRADDPGALVKAVSEILAETSDAGLDASGEEVFELIKPLNDDVALSLISALTKVPGNEPIGAIAQPVEVPKTTSTSSTKSTSQSGTRSAQSSGGSWRVIILTAVVIFVVLWFLKSRSKS